MKSNVIDLASRKRPPTKNSPDCRATYFEMSMKVRVAATQLYRANLELAEFAATNFSHIRPEADEVARIGIDKVCDAIDMIQEGLGILEDAVSKQTTPVS